MSASLQALGERLSDMQKQRTHELLQAAAAESCLDTEEVITRLIENLEFVLLTAEAIDAARRTRLDGKAKAPGASLGALIADDALLDLESVWIRILATVEPPHIKILKFFLEHTATMGTGSTPWGTGPIMKVSEVGEALGLNEAVLPLIQDLIRAGLVMDPVAEGVGTETGTYVIADAFSRLLLAPLGPGEPRLIFRHSDGQESGSYQGSDGRCMVVGCR